MGISAWFDYQRALIFFLCALVHLFPLFLFGFVLYTWPVFIQRRVLIVAGSLNLIPLSVFFLFIHTRYTTYT